MRDGPVKAPPGIPLPCTPPRDPHTVLPRSKITPWGIYYSEHGSLRRAPQDRHHPAGVIALIVVIAGLLVGLVMGALGGGVVFGALGAGGAVLAADVSGLLDDAVLLTLFSALLVVVAAAMIVKNTRRRSPRPSLNHDGPENRPV